MIDMIWEKEERKLVDCQCTFTVFASGPEFSEYVPGHNPWFRLLVT